MPRAWTVDLALEVEADDEEEAARIGDALAKFLRDSRTGWAFVPVSDAQVAHVHRAAGRDQ
jgi:hypothetical protein